MAKSPDYPVPALEKGLDLLEALAAAPVAQSLAELAVSLERSSSSLFRMLNCLENRGYITRDEVSGKYHLTLKLHSLAHAHSSTEKLLRAARLPMQQLTELYRESCHLSVLERGKLLVIAQQESPERVRLSIEVGSVFDPEQTASGRLLMAFLPENERESIVRAGNLSGKARSALDDSLAETRRRGLSEAESETVEGVHDLSVLVGDPASQITAALAVTRLMRRGRKTDDTALLTGMQKAAEEITRTLGLKVR